MKIDEKLAKREFPTQVVNRDLLKYIALLLMTLGHWALLLLRWTHNRTLVRFATSAEFFAPPVFFFFIAEGYHYSKDKGKYALRLLIFAIVTQVPNALSDPDGLTPQTLFLRWSVLMTLFLGLCSLLVLHGTWRTITFRSRKDEASKKWEGDSPDRPSGVVDTSFYPLRFLVIAGLMGISYVLNSEWAVGGIAVILMFDLLRNMPLLRLVVYIPLIYCVVWMNLEELPTLTSDWRILVPMWCAGIVVTFLYSGKKGHFPRFSKYFFYVWYPLHLLIQWAAG